MAKARIKLKKQRNQGRIRRRPSFYRTRKESELKEFPRVTHRVSINPNEEYFSSSIVPPTSSTSGVYSSSTTTDYTTTTTTNTIVSTDRASSSIISTSPTMLKVNNPITDHRHQQQSHLTTPHTGKRFSIVQFFNPLLGKTAEEQLASDDYHLSNFNEIDHNDLRSNETSIDESTNVPNGPASNIIVYVDDYGSAICSSCDAEGSGISNGVTSYYPPETDYVQDDEDEEEDEEIEDEEEEEFSHDSPFNIVINIAETNDADSAIDEITVKQSSSLNNIPPTNRKTSTDIIKENNEIINKNFLEPPEPDIKNQGEPGIFINPNPDPELNEQNNTTQDQEQRPGCTKHRHHSKKHKRRRIRQLKFKNKILRFDNGTKNNANENKIKEESKAAKTLTIITGD